MTNFDAPLALLGGMSARTFLDEYWQKKPLLIRAGLVGFQSPLDANELAGMAMEPEVESRIVIEHGTTPWELRQGPFDEESFERLPDKEWTLLVQAVDHWVPAVQALKEQFQFVPSWRLDDVMISYATEGGSVGPHYDQYDVFLVQVAGKRRWQVLAPDQYQDSAIEDVPLHILDNFTADESMDWVLEAGDILYLPPNYAHNGRSLDDDCMTYSVGFRAPSMQDALTGVCDTLCEELTLDDKRRFSVPESAKREHPAAIIEQDLDYLKAELQQLIDHPQLLAQWLGSTMSDIKYPELAAELDEQEVNETFNDAVNGDVLIRPGDARICYYLSAEVLTVFCNGESLKVSSELTAFVQALCDQSKFEFSDVDLQANKDIELLIRFLIGQQGIVAMDSNK